MPALVSNEETERCLRACLTAERATLLVYPSQTVKLASVSLRNEATRKSSLRSLASNKVLRRERRTFMRSSSDRSQDSLTVRSTASSPYLVDLSLVCLRARGTTGKHGRESGRLFQNLQFGLLTLRPDHIEEPLGMNGPPSNRALKRTVRKRRFACPER